MSGTRSPRATVFCPSVPTITIDCDNDRDVKFSVCLVRPIGDGAALECEIDQMCALRADDPDQTLFRCYVRDVAAVASLPSSLTFFSLFDNKLRRFMPSFPQGPSQLNYVDLERNSIERMDDVHIPATTTELNLRGNPIKELKFHRGNSNVVQLNVELTQIRSIEKVTLPPCLRVLSVHVCA
ncbi:hypothetical protein PINS_up004190 [Pythium insidiosum]|nr:hypothetical protein PINS_up004190 [Pythium insidiosum]